MKPFIEPTKGQTPPTWADIDWHAVEMNVGRLQERIYRATKDGDWMRVKSLQKLLARATSTKLLAIRRVTQENQGKKTAGGELGGGETARSPAGTSSRGPEAQGISTLAGPTGLHPQGQRQAEALGHTDGEGPGDAG